MIEELKLLIPLLENTGDGAFWLVIMYLSSAIFKMIIVVGAVLFAINMIIKYLKETATSKSIDDMCVNEAVKNKLKLYILETIKTDSSYIYDEDFFALARTIVKHEKIQPRQKQSTCVK